MRKYLPFTDDYKFEIN